MAVPAAKAKRAKKIPRFGPGDFYSLSILKWCCDNGC